MLRADLEELGFTETAVVPTDGHPGVWGYYDAGAERTLMVYMMYDVQPVNPEDWESHPFEANVIQSELGAILMARGATNQKGPERAFLNAIESIIAVEGTLPVNLMVLAEGEEERMLRACQVLVDDQIAVPVLVGRPAVIEQRIQRFGLRLREGEHYSVVNPEFDPRYREYWQSYYELMKRSEIGRAHV